MKHGIRGAVTAWLALIALQTVTSKGGSGKVAGAFSALDSIVKRALSPNVAAIPDRRTGAATTSAEAQVYNMTPAQLQQALNGANAATALQGATSPGGVLYQSPSLSQYVAGGGLPAGIGSNLG